MSERRLEGLDLNLVLTLHWLLTEQSVSRAAGRLGVSQPAVSHGLKRLRELFGDPLLVKSGKVMRTTPRADRMKPQVSQLVAGMRDLFQTEANFDPAAATGRFRVSASDNCAVLVARAWAKVVAPLAPKLALDVVAIDFPVAQDLISGSVDLVMMPEVRFLTPPPGLDLDQFVHKPLCHEPFRTGVPDSSPLAGRPLTLQAFLSEPHVLVNPEGASLGVVDEALAKRGLSRRIAYRAESFLAAAAIARSTGCILTAPASTFLALPEGFEVGPPPIDVEGFGLVTGWHPNWTADPRHRWLRERLTEGLNAVIGQERPK
ncbi:LysR family transcriptional regulator [Parvularcula dongshanensis]|uniref:DNA-binding transcriptional LysR family regulator n=1 Tax=Parvularcula dongshanensis TaxID=1173995 RepID=A0A840I396_9PROT|nr:LysR family transcriptional regulator [Parvularcula dongshanensis]MBB4659247.1 DNA-binding transcriptional LysR family regulator [Parvularcula dongshanensis]